jgi:hypothetical protein
MLTITDNIAYVRGGPPDFKQTKATIPVGTRIDVIESKEVNGKTYARIANHDTVVNIGWTLRSNVQDIEEKFKAARATRVYFAAGHYLMVYLPKNGIAPQNLEVFMFFHGIGGDYASTATNKKNGGFVDNTGISADLPGAVDESGRNVVAICVQANNKQDPEWTDIKQSDYKAMVDTVLRHLRADLQLQEALAASSISLAGHSAGGKALGPAALGLDAQDGTLLDAGYGYDSYQSSWSQLRMWFVNGKGVKQLRIVSKDPKKQAASIAVENTRHMQYVELGRDKIRALAASLQLGPVDCPTVDADSDTPREAGMTLDDGYDLQINGKLQASLRVFAIDPQADGVKAHWGVKDEAMLATLSAGDADDDFAILA